MRQTIAVLIAYGPEVRAFLHSGLIDRLRRKSEVRIVTSNPDSQAFRALAGDELVPAPSAVEPFPLRRLRRLADKAQRRSPLLGRAAARIERAAGGVFGISEEWARLYAELHADCLLTTSYDSVRTLPALWTARNLGLAIVVAANSWKDAFRRPRLPTRPVSVLVAEEAAASALRAANPGLPRDSIGVCGSLHLQSFAARLPTAGRERFCRAAGLDPTRPYICYTAASEASAPEEPRLVAELLDGIAERRLPRSPQLLVRPNPMESGGRFEALARERRDLVVQRPAWEWDPLRDWCCALKQDTEQWAAAVAHSAANVSLASTVTLEFAVAGKPVVNICYGAERARELWEADFYAEARRRKLAVPAHSLDELLSRLGAILREGESGNRPRLRVGDPVGAVARAVEQALAGRESSAPLREGLPREAAGA